MHCGMTGWARTSGWVQITGWAQVAWAQVNGWTRSLAESRSRAEPRSLADWVEIVGWAQVTAWAQVSGWAQVTGWAEVTGSALADWVWITGLVSGSLAEPESMADWVPITGLVSGSLAELGPLSEPGWLSRPGERGYWRYVLICVICRMWSGTLSCAVDRQEHSETSHRLCQGDFWWQPSWRQPQTAACPRRNADKEHALAEGNLSSVILSLCH